MKITAFNGSHRGTQGITHLMVEEFLQGVREAGADVENIALANRSITPCTGCKSCWLATPGRCVHDDDMRNILLPKVIESQILVLATPLYVDNVSGLMKLFLDRLITMGDPHWELDEQGECRHVARHGATPKFVALSTCGYPEQSHFQVLRLLFRRMARNFGTELIAEIYRGGGTLLLSREPEMQALIAQYKQRLRNAGKEVAQQGRLSEETNAELERPFFPNEQQYVTTYLERVNQFWDAHIPQDKQ